MRRSVPWRLWLLVVCGWVGGSLTVSTTQATLVTFSNTTAIVLTNVGMGSVYPSSISVAGFTQLVPRKVTVQVRLTHTYPDDVDILLQGPGGQSVVLMSDVGGSAGTTNLLLTLDDDAPSGMPDHGPLVEASYRPTNVGTTDTFPAPAPAPASDTRLEAFEGLNPNGTWNLYTLDDTSGDSGSIDGWSLTIETTNDVPVPGEIVISEFRLRGPNGANDEFVELYNNTDRNFSVATLDGSGGWALAITNASVRFIVPTGFLLRARAHYLGVNSVGYSLASYPAGTNSTATGDVTYTSDIDDNVGLALFRSANPANFVLSNRLDAVGSTSETNTLYKEGTGYAALTADSIDYSFYRNLHSGIAKDTGNNAADFLFTDSNGTSVGAGQRLGAPGPENHSSPVRLSVGPPSLSRSLVDPNGGVTGAANRVRDFTSVPASNSTFGSVILRRKFTNLTWTNITRLRFRIADLNTFPSPSGLADMRPRTIPGSNVTLSAGGTVAVGGTTLEQPPAQPNGGGCNSTLSTTVSTAALLRAGASTNLQFLLGLQQTGSYRLLLIPETIPPSASPMWLVVGHTETARDVESTGGEIINSAELVGNDVAIAFTATPIRDYRLQVSSSAAGDATWLDIGSVVTGNFPSVQALDTGGAGPAITGRFHRVRVLP